MKAERAIGIETPRAAERPVKAGDRFKITNSGHWGSGKIFVCHRLEHHRLPGYDQALDLGLMAVFWAPFKAPGKPGWHMVPIEWCTSLGPAKVLPLKRQPRKPK